MTDKPPASVAVDQLKTKGLHDLMLAMPVKDGFCRFYGSYVAVDDEACFPDGTTHVCIATETFQPTTKKC
jgi:hypothetical protein